MSEYDRGVILLTSVRTNVRSNERGKTMRMSNESHSRGARSFHLVVDGRVRRRRPAAAVRTGRLVERQAGQRVENTQRHFPPAVLERVKRRRHGAVDGLSRRAYTRVIEKMCRAKAARSV